VAQVAALSDAELLSIRYLGLRSLAEIRSKLATYLAERSSRPEAASDKESLTLGAFPAEAASSEEVRRFQDTTPLSALGLSRRSFNALRRDGIVTVGQLIAMSREQIMMVYGIGKKALAEIESRLTAYLSNSSPATDLTVAQEPLPPSTVSPELHNRMPVAPIERRTLAEQVEQLLAALSDHQRQVIRWRYGLDGEVLTLEEVGKRLGVSRERVRQIQQQALRALRGPHLRFVVRPLVMLLTGLLDQAGGLMNGSQIEVALSRKLAIGDIDLIGAVRLISSLTNAVEWMSRLDACALTRFPLGMVRVINRELVAVLEAAYVPTLVEDLLVAFKNTRVYECHHAELEDAFILACLRAHPQIEIDEDGLCSLEKWNRHRLQKIVLALKQIGEPAHYSVIAERANAMLPVEQRGTPRNIHAELGRRTDLFVRVGHGIFGLKEWGLPDDGSLANAAYRVLSEAGKPLHIEVIADRVLETWQARRSSVCVAVDQDERFINIGDGVYWLREQMAEGEKAEETADFGDLFGKRLEHWQIELDLRESDANHDTHAEADAIRQVGLDFFG